LIQGKFYHTCLIKDGESDVTRVLNMNRV